MIKIVLASNNNHKVKEFEKILGNTNIELIPQRKLGIPEIPETGLTFLENSILKARNASLLANMPAIADDSGIEVDALSGRPGIYSARYAGEGASDLDNRNKIIEELNKLNLESLPAYYVCVLVGVHSADDPMPIFSSGEIHGDISIEASGEGGFGYDKLFYPYGYSISMATMDSNEKNRISHRAIATNIFLEKLENIRAK